MVYGSSCVLEPCAWSKMENAGWEPDNNIDADFNGAWDSPAKNWIGHDWLNWYCIQSATFPVLTTLRICFFLFSVLQCCIFLS